jgi:GntR family carbon starvation induced transcriptional regulator
VAETKPTGASLLTDRLREEIVSGAVPPGAKLKLVPLARRFEVSRGPLREAATRLAAEGLVSIEDQRGFRVTPISRADLMDLTQTRQRIEVLALRDAMEAGDLAWEGRVIAAFHMLDRVTSEGGAGGVAFQDYHHDFHEALVSACPSAYLLDFRERLYALTERYRNLAADGYASGRGDRDIAAEHRALAEAAVARQVDSACALLAEHLGETARTLLLAYPELFGGPE